MIIGLILKNYKAYKGNIFIPLAKGKEDNLSVIVGKNGVGKSTILEALDSFFNNKDFAIHRRAASSDCYVAPVFLIEKKTLKLSQQQKNILEQLSSFFWDFNDSNLKQFNNIKDFFSLRDSFKESLDQGEHFLFLLDSVADSPRKSEFGPFGSFVYKHTYKSQAVKFKTRGGRNNVSEKKNDHEEKYKKEIVNIRRRIVNAYNYVYIPVETSISDFLRLETEGMQKLMNQDVLSSISKIISKKILINDKNSSIESHLNLQLDEFIEEIEDQVKTIDPSYTFKVEKGWKRLTAANIRDKIIEAYLSKRELKQNSLSIRELSSGERRKAIIDVAYAFLNEHIEKENDKITILAIDEPEASLNISLMFEQFFRLQELTKNKHNQVLITTHWYGSLPLIQEGSLLNITKSADQTPKINHFQFYDYFSSKKEYFLDEISLKSYFDLTSSVFSSIISRKQNWLFCEGPDDKNYLEYYFDQKVDNLRVICVGGCSHLIKIYKYLLTPINEEFSSKKADKLIKGKVYFLMDSDETLIDLTCPSNSSNNAIYIRRLQIVKERIKLLPLSGNHPHSVTEMEDSLLPKQFYEALKKAILDYGTSEEKKAIENFSFNEKAIFSNLKGENGVLLIKNLTNQVENKQIVIDFLENHYNKYQLSRLYCTLSSNEDAPSWVQEIIDFFMNQ